MAPTLIREPFRRPGWIYEEKVDGWRMLAYKDRDHVRLVSRNGVDHTLRFAGIAAAIAKLSPRTLVLDGEGLFCNGRDLCARRLRDRRARLEDVVAGSELVFPVRRLAAARA